MKRADVKPSQRPKPKPEPEPKKKGKPVPKKYPGNPYGEKKYIT